MPEEIHEGKVSKLSDDILSNFTIKKWALTTKTLLSSDNQNKIIILMLNWSNQMGLDEMFDHPKDSQNQRCKCCLGTVFWQTF